MKKVIKMKATDARQARKEAAAIMDKLGWKNNASIVGYDEDGVDVYLGTVRPKDQRHINVATASRSRSKRPVSFECSESEG